jgi:hypothetical protein
MVEDVLHGLHVMRLGASNQQGVAGQGVFQLVADVTAVLKVGKVFHLFLCPAIFLTTQVIKSLQWKPLNVIIDNMIKLSQTNQVSKSYIRVLLSVS